MYRGGKRLSASMQIARRIQPLLSKLALALTRRVTLPLSLSLVLLSAAGDYATGVEVTFTMLYLVPIAIGTWFHGRVLGWCLALLALLCGFATNLVEHAQWHSVSRSDWARQAHSYHFTMLWNQLGAFAIFAIIVWLLDRLNEYVRREQNEKRQIVAQLRHSERLNTIGTLAAGVAHELGTPMNVILGRAKIVAGHAAGSAVIEENARIIVQQTERMTRIIRQLVDFAHTESGAKTAHALRDLATLACGLVRDLAERKGIKLHVEGDDSVVVVDAGQIEQVLSNLVINAIHASAAGSEIQLRVASRAIMPLNEKRERDFACVDVVDQGTGMTREIQARIFEPFFTTKDVGGGTGLGLSVAHGIVQEHGGWIQVQSEAGTGSTLTVCLPKLAT